MQVKDFWEKAGVKTLNWPGNSPDLNPIENLWNSMGVKISKCKPSSIKQLEMLLEKIWYEEISIDTLKSLVESMPRRVAAVIAAKGASTKY